MFVGAKFKTMFGFGGFFGRRRGFAKPKAKKIPKENWFERLNQSELKDILEAANLKKTGTKKEQSPACSSAR